jgi:hypothetical protein
LHGYMEFLNEQLGLNIRPTVLKGDIYLSGLEKSWDSQVHELTGEDTPFWIIVAGGKFDVTLKWWEHKRYQEVVDYFAGRIQFVQVGAQQHHHPPLNGVIDLRGRTNLRQLTRLVYHAQGVVCPVTCLMHLAAAVETKKGNPPRRPCVVIAGGREPPQWETYPFHEFIHTVGALPCCKHGGCWKLHPATLLRMPGGDKPEDLCTETVGPLPRCLDMIGSAEVIHRIVGYFEGGAIRYLSPRQHRAASTGVRLTRENARSYGQLQQDNARMAAEAFLERIPSYPGTFRGRGIVICAGGTRLFTNAWICLNMLRRLGCDLPVELWHLGRAELDREMASLVKSLRARCVDAHAVRKRNPVRILRGWELKPFTIIHCQFQEVLLLDADNLPVVNPAFLFDTPEFKSTGAIFWPDYGRLDPDWPTWELCGVPYRDEPEFETGQVVVHKEACWRSLQLCLWYNEHSDFFYKFTLGDKETFHMAWRKLGQPYAMPNHPVVNLDKAVMCQHDFEGRRIFQHRNGDKWDLWNDNRSVAGFSFEKECREYLNELRSRWSGKRPLPRRTKPRRQRCAAKPLRTSVS